MPDNRLLSLARTLAEDFSAHTGAPASFPNSEFAAQFAPLVELIASPALVTETIYALKSDADRASDASPRRATSLAHLACGLAKLNGDARAAAECAQTLVIALNRLGEYHQALTWARESAATLIAQHETERAAVSLCQAAWANRFISNLADAQADLNRARELCSAPSRQPLYDWIQAWLYSDQGEFDPAIQLFQQARAALEKANLGLYAARCARDLAHCYIVSGRENPIPLLQNLRAYFDAAHSVPDVLLSDFLVADFGINSNSYKEPLEILDRIQPLFLALGMEFYAARCNVDRGVIYRHLDRYPESLQALERACDYFRSHHLAVELSNGNISLGNSLYSLNRYAEAFDHYQYAAELAVRENRMSRAAVCYLNMGLAQAQRDLFAPAIDWMQRALQIYRAERLDMRAALAAANLALVYRKLGQSSTALEYLQDARGSGCLA